MALIHKKIPSLCFGAALILVYLSERVLEPGHTGAVALLLGLAALIVALVLAIRQGKGRAAGLVLPTCYGLGLLALVLYFSRSTLPALLGYRALEVSHPKLDGAFAALWPALMLASLLPVLLVEFALASMARAPVIDGRRVRTGMRAGMGVACALVFGFAVYYVASERNRKADLSFFRTARASAVTKQLVAALDKPIEVTLFYPPGSDVAEELAGYFGDLGRVSSKLTVTRVDHAVELGKAKTLGISSNGAVAIASGPLHEQIQIPPKLEAARGKLRALDQEAYKRILSVSRGKRTVYLVQGHEERSFATQRQGSEDALLRHLKELLAMQYLDTRDLGLSQGLGNEVPADAAMVLVVGPQRPMLEAETAALLAYFRRGGRLLIAADPEAASAVAPLLAGLSLELSPSVLAHDRIHWARTHQKTDRTGIGVAGYSPHPALATLAQYGAQMPLVLLNAGALDKTKNAPNPAPAVEFIVKTDVGTWSDANGNFDFDKESEQRKAYPVVAAVSMSKGSGTAAPTQDPRAVVVGDSDALSDLLIVNQANALFAMDVIRWLLGEPEAAGPMSNEEDVPVRHTRKQDVFWFYSTVFLAPALVLGLGWVATRSRRKREVKS